MKKIGIGINGFAGQSFYHYGFVTSAPDNDQRYQITRGIEIINNGSVCQPLGNYNLQVIDETVSDWNGIKSIEIEKAPLGWYKAVFLDLEYRVADYGIIQNDAQLRNTDKVKDFNTMQEAQAYLQNLPTTKKLDSIPNIPQNTGNLQGINIGDKFIVSEKAVVQIPTFSAYSKKDGGCLNASPCEYAVYNADGLLIKSVSTGWDVPTDTDCFDNHPAGSYTPLPFGSYTLKVKNNSPESLVAGIISIWDNNPNGPSNNYAYAMYHEHDEKLYMGLDRAQIAKEIHAGETVSIPLILNKERQYNDGNNPTHVEIILPLIINGKVYGGHCKVDYGDGTLYNANSLFMPLNQVTRIKIIASDLADTWVQVEINPNERSIKLLSASNATISEMTAFISVKINYNNVNQWATSYYNQHWRNNFKIFNNKGNISADGLSIINQNWGQPKLK